jgi:hypothetical protein
MDLIAELVHELEKLYVPGYVPGTMISRSLLKDQSIGWSVAAGYMQRPKLIVYDADLIVALQKAIAQFPSWHP